MNRKQAARFHTSGNVLKRLMPRKNAPKWNIEELTDREISVLIRYLDSDRDRENHGEVLVICVSLVIVLLGWLGYFWLFRCLP